jgi:Na+-transporting NADH:ubiquinone oxidoreductase subunit NqrB
MAIRAALLRDPRILQIAFLSAFLATGVAWLGFELPLWQPPLIIATALGTQWALTHLTGAPPSGYRSPLISSLGLSLLLRTDVPWIPVLAAFAAIASKFIIRFRGKHIFNPTNFGLAVAMLSTPRAWCSPSQWGDNAALIAWLAILGLAVAHRAFRSDISLAFLGSWLLLKASRVIYLGQKLPVLVHQLSAGSLILFAFFMISDPKTTPDSRLGRVLYATIVASFAFYWQHGLWKQNALIWSLFLLSPLVLLIDRIFMLLIDRIFKADRYHWPIERTASCSPVSVPT